MPQKILDDTSILSKVPEFEVTVDAETIRTSVPEDSSNCMTAMAIARARPEAKRIEVDVQQIRFTEGELRFVYITPYGVKLKIHEFEDGKLPEAFRFKLGKNEISQILEANPINKQLTREEYEPIRRAMIKTQRQGETILDKIATETKTKSSSFKTYLSPHGKIPSVKKTKEILEVAIEQLPNTHIGEMAKEKIEYVKAKIVEPKEKPKYQPKAIAAKGETVVIVGGEPPPLIRAGSRRQFGIRMGKASRFDKKE